MEPKIEFSEMAQEAARKVLSTEDRSPETFFKYAEPFYHMGDIRNLFLVSATFFSVGGNIIKTIRFAEENKHNETYRPILSWVKDQLLGKPGKAGKASVIPRLEVNRLEHWAHEWLKENQGDQTGEIDDR